MMINYIWAFFFVGAFVAAAVQCFFGGNTEIWNEMATGLFDTAKTAFSISINLTGILCFWLGMLKIAEKSGITDLLAKALYPLFRKIMPGLKKDSPAFGSIVMNMAANMLGLDNAATPMGLKAMEQMQIENKNKDVASNEQILFMVINSSAVTLLPITIFMYRSELGSSNPAMVFLPILLATSVSTIVGFLSVAFVQRLNIFNRVVLTYAFIFLIFVLCVACGFVFLNPVTRSQTVSVIGNFVLIFFVFTFVMVGLIKKVNVYDEFINGAKEGFNIAVAIIPYLVAMLVAIAFFRASGMLDMIVNGVEKVFWALNINADFVKALPTALLKPLSGSGARAMMIETMKTYGADSFAGFTSSIIQGSTETTFYVLAVYFGAVKINNTRHALPCALLADLAGVVAAIVLGYWFYSGNI